MALTIAPKEKLMQFALLIYESPEAFAGRKSDGTDPYTSAWRAYYKALVQAGIYVGGDPLEVPETGTTVRLKEGKRRVQDGSSTTTTRQRLRLTRSGSIYSPILKEPLPEGATKRRKRPNVPPPSSLA